MKARAGAEMAEVAEVMAIEAGASSAGRSQNSRSRTHSPCTQSRGRRRRRGSRRDKCTYWRRSDLRAAGARARAGAEMAMAVEVREAREATGMGWLHTRSTQTRPRKYRGR